MSVRVKDRGADALRAVLRKAHGARIRIGIFQGSGAALVQIASYHELGAPGAHIPRRSFLVDTVTAKQRALFAQGKTWLAAAAKQTLPLPTALARLGAFAVGLVQQRIADRIAPPLKPATIARKKSDVPLIDTGALRQAITFEVKGG